MAHSTAERSYPTSEIRDTSREDPMPEGQRPRGVTPLPRSGAAAKSARPWQHRSSQEDLPHIRGQGQQPGGAIPRPRISSWAGAGGPRGSIPCSGSEGVGVRIYLSSKVGSSGCTLLEQLWRDTPLQGKRNPSKMVGAARGHQRVDTLKP